MIYGDLRAIKQVVINLLSNAVKFSKDGDKVSVSASQKADGTIEVVVSDSGEQTNDIRQEAGGDVICVLCVVCCAWMKVQQGPAWVYRW